MAFNWMPVSSSCVRPGSRLLPSGAQHTADRVSSKTYPYSSANFEEHSFCDVRWQRVGCWGRRKENRTEARDVQGKRLRLTRDGLAYGEEFVPLDEVDVTRPASDVFWNPATKLFEVSVFRRRGPPLVLMNLPPGVAERLRGAMVVALRGRRP